MLRHVSVLGPSSGSSIVLAKVTLLKIILISLFQFCIVVACRVVLCCEEYTSVVSSEVWSAQGLRPRAQN